MHILTSHQKKQVDVINKIEDQIKNNSVKFSVVAPVKDYEIDNRIALTSVHLLKEELVNKIQKKLIIPLRKIYPKHYYYPSECLHMTIKGMRVINYPPQFTKYDIEKSKNIFSINIPKHKKFNVYFYRLMLFPTNLALIGTTDPQLDDLIMDLDKKLISAGINDDKIYTNTRYYFSNVTLVRFYDYLSLEWIKKVNDLSKSINFSPYTVDSVSLLTCNAVLKKREIFETWKLI